MRPVVVKVGGSLFDWPELRDRLDGFLSGQSGPMLIVPGGGAAADAVRDLDRVHRLGETTAHWLALRACSLNAVFLAHLLAVPITTIVPATVPRAVVDLFAFAEADERVPTHLPHTWDVTSDSLAVRVAVIAGASDVILLKSTDNGDDLVDRHFEAVRQTASDLRVRIVNLRTWTAIP